MKYLLLLAILVLTQIGCATAVDDGCPEGFNNPTGKAMLPAYSQNKGEDTKISIDDEKTSSRTDASCTVKWGLPLTILGSLAMAIPVMLKLYGSI